MSIQKRLKKEKKAKRRLQEALDFESRRRQQVERTLKHSDLLAGNLKRLASELASCKLTGFPALVPQTQ